MLEQFVKGWGICYVIAALCLLGSIAKLQEGRIYKKLLRAAQEPERTDQPFMKQVRLKYKSYHRLEHQIHNIDAFIENHLFRYKTHGVGLERLHGITGSMMLLCVMASCMGVAVSVGMDLGNQYLMYHIVAGAIAVTLLEWVDVQSGTDSRRRMLIASLKDYLENVLANNLERAPESEQTKQRERGVDKQAQALEKKMRPRPPKEVAATEDIPKNISLEEAIAETTITNTQKHLTKAQEKIIAEVIKEFL